LYRLNLLSKNYSETFNVTLFSKKSFYGKAILAEIMNLFPSDLKFTAQHYITLLIFADSCILSKLTTLHYGTFANTSI